jgi:hypothetical protein
VDGLEPVLFMGMMVINAAAIRARWVLSAKQTWKRKW